MSKSKVYFSDFRTRLGVSQGVKLQRLIKKAGIGDIDFDGKFVAIKMHFGELGNFAYLRPNYVKAVADVIKDLGGKPFLTDCNTLYPGSRKNASPPAATSSSATACGARTISKCRWSTANTAKPPSSAGP